MNKVGILSEDFVAICSPEEMLAVFWHLKEQGLVHPLVSDRLYKRYLSLDQLGEAKCLLSTSAPRGDKKHRKIIEAIVDAIDASSCFYKKFHEYAPLRLGVTEIPNVFEDEFRDLSEYDNLEGPPFWLREYLQEYPNAELPF